MMTLRKHITLFVLITITILLGSCGTGRNANFTKQKFTKLKQFSTSDNAKPESTVLSFSEETKDSTSQETVCDTIFMKDGTFILATNVSEKNDEITFSSCPDGDSQYSVLKSLTLDTKVSPPTNEAKDESNPILPSGEPGGRKNGKKDRSLRGNQREFEKLSTKEQNEQRVKFRKAMNMSLLFLALAALAILLGIFYVWAFLGLIALVPAFVSALVAITNVKRIDRTKQSASFRLRHFIMQLVVAIGVIACIASLTMWLVLLILWGARVI
ncbi:MAG: hypothetical protein BM555_05255 [Crocinitomix sp. MedPE-SWsnd]|nr:MAG: hypothetical protein BM555_05255 [Crocinitomix sp. MedPE-SWsnd]